MKPIPPFIVTHWFKLSLLALIGLGVLSLFTPYPARLVRALRATPPPEVRIVERVKRVEVPVEVRVETPAEQETTNGIPPQQAWQPAKLLPMAEIQLPPFPPALPQRLESGTFENLTALSRGLNLESKLTFTNGTTASQDRINKKAYLAKVSIELLLPHAANGKELLHANPDLPKVLTRFHDVMAHAKVSHWYHSLYLHKQNRLRKNLATLSQPLDRHNFYDTDTILEISAPDTHRRVLWIQADMDIVSDGSDGDRLPTMPEAIRKSDYYQPTTSYRWKKRTKNPNPLLANWEARLAKLKKDPSKNNSEIDYAQRVIFDLKRYSYLLAQYDPFIVLPLTLKEGKNDTYRPQPGDYAVVIVGKKVIPAIVGDYGPKYKSGEASLRLGKLVTDKAGVYSRAVSSLGASYVVFPHTAEPEAGPIDYERLNTRCRELLDELGGISPEAEFISVDDMLAPKPPAEQTPPAADTPNEEQEDTPDASVLPHPAPSPDLPAG